MDTFLATSGETIEFATSLEQLKFEYVLQSERSAWRVIPHWPYLAIDRERVDACVVVARRFAVFSIGELWQKLGRQDHGTRLLGPLVEGASSTSSGVVPVPRAFVEGKSDENESSLVNWNVPLAVESSPWCAGTTDFIFVDNEYLFQYTFAELITNNGPSYLLSPHFDFTALVDLRNRFIDEYLQFRNSSVDLSALSKLLDDAFVQNALCLSAATAYHDNRSGTLGS